MTRERRRRCGVAEGVGRYSRRSDVPSDNVACRLSSYMASEQVNTYPSLTSTITNHQPPAYTEQNAVVRPDHSDITVTIDNTNRTSIRNCLGEASFLPPLQRFPRLQGSRCTHTRTTISSPVVTAVTTPQSTICMISEASSQETDTPTHNPTVAVSGTEASNSSYAENGSIRLPEYTITELPRNSVDQPFYMMSNNNNQTSTSTNQPVQPVTCSDTIDCLPPPFYIPTPPPARRHHRRRRRHRRNRRRHHRRRHADISSSQMLADDERIKPCCSSLGCKICLSLCLQFQKVLIFFATFGILCVLTGIILGVLRAPGNSFFTLSLMFVGKYRISQYRRFASQVDQVATSTFIIIISLIS